MSERAERWASWLGATVAPVALTAVLSRVGPPQQRDYVFGYLALVAIVGVFGGLWPALVCAGLSFLLVDWFFVQPLYTFTIADEQDIVNLLAFVATAVIIGLLASRRRAALLESEALTRQLREANAELVRLNKEQAQAAQAALRLARTEQEVRALQETERLRRELLANVSHELRTPLGTILTESTDAEHAQSIGEAQRRMETIANEARRLNALVDDMLDMARIEGGALELDLEPILLADAIAAAVDRLHMASAERIVEWDQHAAAVEVLADWDRLGQVLDNLLANADRFSLSGQPIEVGVVSESAGLVKVSVADHGPGVEPELRDRVFERFVRGTAPPVGSAHSARTGLGLAIVKGLVEAHAGTAGLEERRNGHGAVFWFTVPVPPG